MEVIMASSINQGDTATCIRSFEQNNEILFSAGKEYPCPIDNCITDNFGANQIGWNADMVKEHFIIAKTGGK
jgi:hypothetical protein